MKKFTSALIFMGFVIFSLTGVGRAYVDFTEKDVDALLSIRPLMFGGVQILAGIQQSTINGAQPPIFGYNAADRTIISWKIKDEMAESFAQAIGLPPGMSLSKASPITTKYQDCRKKKFNNRHHRKNYYMMVDIANTERFVEGTKVEWKTFVTVGADPVPRILRFDSQNSNPGVDLLDVSAPGFDIVEWGIEENIVSGLITNGAHTLDISIPLECSNSPESAQGESILKKQHRFTEAFLTASEHVYSPLGSHSRYFYDGSSVSAKILTVNKRDVSITNTFPWAAFVDDLDSVTILPEKTKHLVQPIGVPVQRGSYESRLFRRLLVMILFNVNQEYVFKRLEKAKESEKYLTLYYGLLDFYQALQIYAGQELPKMVFSLKKRPMAVFINFEIPEENIGAFKNAFLPSHFELAKIRFYPEQKKAVYAVSLNVYEAVGPNISGYRAEWSTYVINPNEDNPKPRFSVLEAQSTALGFDPLIVLEKIENGEFDIDDLRTLLEDPADIFEYSLDKKNGLSISLFDFDEEIEVDVSIPYPDRKNILRTHPLKRWMEANDFVYWGEAADVIKYDSNVMFAKLIVFEAGSDATINDTTFSKYVDPKPLPIIFWNGVQDIALEPWGNVQDIILNN